MEVLKAYRNRRYVGVAELTQAAAEILSAIGETQEKKTVTEIPDERTVRYYLSENLLAPPAGREGTASVFGYEHLLSLVAIKKLQSENLSIRKIRELLAGKTIDEIEKIVGAAGDKTAAGKNSAQEYLESLLFAKAPARDSPPSPPMAAPARAAASPPPPPPTAADQENWKRFRIADGLELHVGEKFRPPVDDSARRRLIEVIEEIIRARTQK